MYILYEEINNRVCDLPVVYVCVQSRQQENAIRESAAHTCDWYELNIGLFFCAKLWNVFDYLIVWWFMIGCERSALRQLWVESSRVLTNAMVNVWEDRGFCYIFCANNSMIHFPLESRSGYDKNVVVAIQLEFNMRKLLPNLSSHTLNLFTNTATVATIIGKYGNIWRWYDRDW